MSSNQQAQKVTNPVTESRFGRVYRAATTVALLSASVAVTTLAAPIAWDRLQDRESVSSSELSRLVACDQAVKHAATYDVAVQTGRDVETPLHAYWAAKDACGATVTLQASK